MAMSPSTVDTRLKDGAMTKMADVEMITILEDAVKRTLDTRSKNDVTRNDVTRNDVKLQTKMKRYQYLLYYIGIHYM